MTSRGVEELRDEVYALPRGKQETQRLDQQHRVFTRLADGLIHPSIPKQHIRKVADVATGTGIWLVDVATEFSCEGHYVGFDLSDSQFPTPTSLPQSCSLDFKVHDMTRRFPPEYHAQFDLINIRLVVQALKAVNVDTVISNVLELLSASITLSALTVYFAETERKEPGGHIQWGDVNWNEVRSIPSNTELDMMDEIITGHMKYHGLSSTLPDLVETALRGKGARDVIRSDSYSDSHQSISVEEGTCVLKEAEMGMLPKALETVREFTPQSFPLQEIVIRQKAEEALSNQGQIWRFSYTVVVGRKGI